MKKITLLCLMLVSSFAFSQVSIVEDFDAGTPAGWTDTYTNSATDACAGNTERDNLYSFSTTGNLTSPNQVAASNATDLVISFDYKIEEWNSQTAQGAGWGTAELQYSTDDGVTWTTALTIDDSNHVIANTCATMMATVPAASLPMGSDVKIQIANTWAAGDYDFHIDNFSATQTVTMPPNCDATLTDISAAGDITWSGATGVPTGYKLTAGTTTGGTDLANNVDVGDVLTYNVGALMAGSTYYVTIVPYNANGDATGCTEQTFTVLCLDPTAAAASNITDVSADLGWTENNGATTWNIEWGPDGFTQGTGTLVSGSTTNPHPLTGLTATTAYDFYVQTDCGSATSAWVGPISFTTANPPPANDDFANAQALACNDNIMGSTADATLDEDDAPDGFGADMDAPNVWFSYTGSGSAETITIDLCPSSYDTSFLVYTGTSGSLTLIGGNDDNGAECTSTTRSYATFTSDGTSTYYIAVEGWNSTSTGDFDLTITCAPACTPAQTNQDCASATAAAVDGVAFTVDNTCADVNPTQPTCDSFNSIADVWYSFVAPASGEVAITSALGTATAVHMAVYSGACGSLTEEGCSSAATGSLTLTTLTAGNTYYLQLWNNGSEEGTFDVTIIDNTLSVESAETRGFTHYLDTVNDKLVLNAQSAINTVEVYNLTGQVINTVQPRQNQAHVSLNSVKRGIYFARVTLNDGRTSVVKFSK